MINILVKLDSVNEKNEGVKYTCIWEGENITPEQETVAVKILSKINEAFENIKLQTLLDGGSVEYKKNYRKEDWE